MRLGITYGVLRRLGFSEARVEECLRAMLGVDLDEAYEWVNGPLIQPTSCLMLDLLVVFTLHARRTGRQAYEILSSAW